MDEKKLKLMIRVEAARMLDDVIAQCYSYNAYRREKKSFNGEEIHFRTLELMQRYAETARESAELDLQCMEDEVMMGAYDS
jgi:hypothetical protein